MLILLDPLMDEWIYTLKHFHKCNFIHQRIQENEHCSQPKAPYLQHQVPKQPQASLGDLLPQAAGLSLGAPTLLLYLYRII